MSAHTWGQSLTKKSLDILIRFHTYKILTANIEKAFLLVSVQEYDCDVLRFLWFDMSTARIATRFVTDIPE